MVASLRRTSSFRRTLRFDDATWARARGWVVEQAVFYIPYYAKSLPFAVDQARKRLSEACRFPTNQVGFPVRGLLYALAYYRDVTSSVFCRRESSRGAAASDCWTLDSRLLKRTKSKREGSLRTGYEIGVAG